MENDIKEKVLYWLANGETGLSSKVMAFTAAGIKTGNKYAPCDPDDFNRCLLLVEQVPEIRNHFEKISRLSNKWRNLIAHWDAVENQFLLEVGFDWCHGNSAPKTYELMKQLGL